MKAGRFSMKQVFVLIILPVMIAICAGCGNTGKKEGNGTDSAGMSKENMVNRGSRSDTGTPLSTDASGSLSLDKTVYRPNEEMVISFTASKEIADNAWIGIVPSNVSHGSSKKNDDNDIDYDFLAAETSGRLLLLAPDTRGSYDIRMSDPEKEITSVSFQVK
jgi:hypothetical protein